MSVAADTLEEWHEGYYDDRQHLIIVNYDSLLNHTGEELTDTVVHEARHAFQHRVVDAYDEISDDLKPLLLFNSSREYKYNFENYENGSEEFSSYYRQECEEDARLYSEYMTDYLFGLIDSYLELDPSE